MRLLESPGPVDYRTTFVRRHVLREQARVDDVLGLVELWKRLAASWRADLKRRLERAPTPDEAAHFRARLEERATLKLFFYGDPATADYPDLKVHLPIRLRPEDPLVGTAADLTDFLLRAGGPPGVVLTARSGAGKTVACRKAFFDCQRERDPLPYLPLWVRIKGIRGHSIERLVLRSAELPDDATEEQLRQWIRHGPRLLLFFDLNRAGIEARPALAKEIADFQAEHAERIRTVITYRSTAADDATMKLLRSSGAFGFHDLLPVDAAHAKAYLRNIRTVEAHLARDFELPEPTNDVDADCAMLEDLLNRHAQGGDSLISTPLLMHWVSILSGRDPENRDRESIVTLAELYFQVVKQGIERDQDLYAPAMPERLRDGPRGRALILAAMTRVALVLQARGATRLEADEVREILEKPENGKEPRVGGAGPWWPKDTYWQRSSYYEESFRPEEVPALLEFSLLRTEDGSIGFHHDSLIYFFAGFYGLRLHEGPAMPLTSGLAAEWFERAAERIALSPEAWELPAEFVGGALSIEQAQRLAEKILLAEPTPGLPSLLLRLLRGRPERTEKARVLRAIEAAVLRHGSLLHKDHRLLFQECHNYLYSFEAESKHAPGRKFAEVLQQRRERKELPWLRCVFPLPLWAVKVMTEHGSVWCVAALEGGRVVSGGGDGEVKIWDPRGINVASKVLHKGAVLSVAKLKGGRVASCGEDGKVCIWDPENHSPLLEVNANNAWARSMAALEGGGVAWGGRDSKVRVWNPTRGEPKIVIEHEKPVWAVAALEGDGLASGGEDGQIWVLNHSGAKPVRVIKYKSPVRAVAAFRGRGVAWGCEDGQVSVWHPQEYPQPIMLPGRKGAPVRSMAALEDGCVAWGCRDGQVCVWSPRNGQTPTEVQPGAGAPVRSMAALEGCGVAWGGEDGNVKIWAPNIDGPPHVVIQHGRKAVRSVAALAGGGVASGGEDGNVKVRTWDASRSPARPVFQHRDEVHSVAVLEGGDVVSGGKDESVKFWDLSKEQMWNMFQHGKPARFVVALMGGGVASGGDDGKVAVWWFPPQVKALPVVQQGAPVRSVAALAGGGVAWGRNDGEVALWFPSNDGKARPEVVPQGTVAPVRSVASLEGVKGGGVAWGCEDGRVCVQHPRNGPTHTVVQPEAGAPVLSVAALKGVDGGGVAWGCEDGQVCVWHLRTDQAPTVVQHGKGAPVRSVAALEGGVVAWGGEDGNVKIWGPNNNRGPAPIVSQHDKPVRSVAALAGGGVASGGKDGNVKVWLPTDHTVVLPAGAPITCLSSNPRRQRIAAGLEDGGVLILDLEPAASLLARGGSPASSC